MGDGGAVVLTGILVATVVGLWIGVRLLVDSGARPVCSNLRGGVP